MAPHLSVSFLIPAILTGCLMLFLLLRRLIFVVTHCCLGCKGYRLLDHTAQCYEISQEMGATPVVSGLYLCPDSLTIDHAEEMCRQLMRSFINFRSQIYKIRGEWYYKEAFDPETVDMNEYLNYIPMVSQQVSPNDSDEEIEEILLQETLTYLNQHFAFNVMWNEYHRAHFDLFYFHFKAQRKCIVFLRFNHSLCDGILMSTLMALIHHQLFNPLHRNHPIDFSKEQQVLPIIPKLMGNEPRSFTLCQRICHYMHFPVALCCFCKYNILSVICPDRQCAFRGEFEPKNKLALSRPIKVSLFKSIAHSHNGTVNDLFLALSIGSMRRYAEKSGCTIFNDPQFEGTFSKLSIMNRRPLDSKSFAKELRVFAAKGTNANALDFTPFRVNVKTINVENAKSAFCPIKYGYTAKIFRSSTESMGSLCGGRKLMVNLTKVITMCSSNMRGPIELIPVPAAPSDERKSRDESDNGGEEKEEDDAGLPVGGERNFVSSLFGIAIPGTIPVNFGLVTYRDHVRIGVIVNVGSIEDPNVLMQCLMEEWQEYAKGQEKEVIELRVQDSDEDKML